MLSHIIYEYSDLEHLSQSIIIHQNKPIEGSNKLGGDSVTQVIDWSLALERSANKPDLAKEMFVGLLDCLNETEQKIKKCYERTEYSATQA